ncbi:DUF1269 domain-containing protein [Curvibacter sp. RS43]|uniref:DUF1269 domain-containing protein n=1 Tax=Curvibacter microcysteis TaxID=3026419 RepID=UPI002361AECB|nr:DUF1269 domain-containing protein [Curvibacter sp. RS43]MDD0809349.1 DUF1269 domain-containing protein [Curvibacter sp. RS43]
MNDHTLSPCFVDDTHDEAERAIQTLNRGGVAMSALSLIGKGYHSEEQPTGFYTLGDKVKAWGAQGAFWGGIWGLLLAPAVFFLPGVGVVALAGPVVMTLVGVLEGAVVLGGLSALGAALSELGVPKDQVLKYETALKVDKYLLLVHGSAQVQAQARDLLQQAPQVQAA